MYKLINKRVHILVGRTGLRTGLILSNCTLWSTCSLPVARNICSTGSVSFPASKVLCTNPIATDSHQSNFHMYQVCNRTKCNVCHQRLPVHTLSCKVFCSKKSSLDHTTKITVVVPGLFFFACICKTPMLFLLTNSGTCKKSTHKNKKWQQDSPQKDPQLCNPEYKRGWTSAGCWKPQY